MSRLTTIASAAALVAALAAPGTSSASTPPAAPSATSPGSGSNITWSACTDRAARDAALQCATLRVPLDHEHPDGRTIDLALVRQPATLARTGSLLFNPGGPGGSGFTPIARNGAFIQSLLGLEHFDIVGFDPRGVDRSGGISCVDGAFIDREAYLDDTPDTPEEVTALETSDARFAAACAAKYGDTLRYYSTVQTAKDMDAIRAALGDQQISFLGISYGTYLGAVYATLFPDRVRAMVLDSAFEPNGDTPEQQFLTQLVGFEGAFRDWIAWCERDTACPFHATDVAGRWTALKHRLDATPLTSGGRPVNQVVLDEATRGSLYSKADWPALAGALTSAEHGDGAALLGLADAHNNRNADGTYDSLVQSFQVISCASGFEAPPPIDLADLLHKITTQAPLLAGETTMDELKRAVQPDCPALVPGAGPVAPVSYSGTAPIVVVGGTNDPATPLRWAEEMTAALGPSARLVTFTGEGHGQFATSTCVTEIEATVLSSLTLPPPGTSCDPDPVVPKPAWWDTVAIPEGISAVTALPSVLAILGLEDTQSYTEARTSTRTPQAVIDAFVAAARANTGADALTVAGTPTIDLPDTTAVAFDHLDGTRLVVVAVGPKAFEDELSSAKADVPPGATVVILAAFPPR